MLCFYSNLDKKHSYNIPSYSNEKSPSYSDKLVLSSIIPNTLLTVVNHLLL